MEGVLVRLRRLGDLLRLRRRGDRRDRGLLLPGLLFPRDRLLRRLRGDRLLLLLRLRRERDELRLRLRLRGDLVRDRFLRGDLLLSLRFFACGDFERL